MTRAIWLISESSPGHDSQSEGLGRSIAPIIDADLVRITGQLTARGWLRPILRVAMGPAGRPLPGALLRRMTDLDIPDGAPTPDLIISSGGKSVIAARTLASRHSVPFVYSGEQKRFPNGWFDAIVSPVPDDPRENAVLSELIPTTVTRETVVRATSQHDRPEGRLWCAVVGGASRSHRFADDDWSSLARGMNALAQREGVRWLVTTSRRTGAHAESILRESLEESTIADAIWWHNAPRRDLHAFLGMSELALVTQDSVTMVTEAVAAGRPVLAVRPKKTEFPSGSFLPSYFERLEDNGRIERLRADELKGWTNAPDAFHPIEGDPTLELSRRVLERLGLTPAHHGPAGERPA